MFYSIAGIIAILVHLIVNSDVILGIKSKNQFLGERHYLFFLLSVIAYHLTDAFWGFLYDAKLANAVFIDTTIYFIAMASSILFWGIFVYKYLMEKNKAIAYTGFVVFAFQIIIIIINFFHPILFKVTEDCVYSALPIRYVMLGAQILMFLVLAVYTLISSFHNKESSKHRHLAISFFSIFMIAAITLQVFFPLLPMYSYGYLFGICALHAFVVQDEKAKNKIELEEVKTRIAIDPLTGVMSKHAYIDFEAAIDERISKGTMEDFAMIVFDLNDLKRVNDEKGHNSGDKYIIESIELIKEFFKDIPIYRVGGDEFVVFLMGDNYEKRNEYLDAFNRRIDENASKNDILVISAGLSIYLRDKDSTILQTYTRADREMYARKHYLKEGK